MLCSGVVSIAKPRPQLDQNHTCLAACPLRALNLKRRRIRRGSLGVQARLQRVDRAEEHVEQVLALVLAIIEELCSAASACSRRLRCAFSSFLIFPIPVRNEVGLVSAITSSAFWSVSYSRRTRGGAFIKRPCPAQVRIAGIAPYLVHIACRRGCTHLQHRRICHPGTSIFDPARALPSVVNQ